MTMMPEGRAQVALPEGTLVEKATSRTLAETPCPRTGRYLLREKIGLGSMGEVWRAEDPQIDRAVAVKLLNVPPGLDEPQRGEWEARFLREARAAGRLSHPGIVPVYDVGQSAEGRPFIVMELIEGRSLDDIMRNGPTPSPEAVLGWGAQVAEALHLAHTRGIIHRDIKPANILIDAASRARIVDFGIARLNESEMTRDGLFLGSPAYASPEQLSGGALDGRSDLFSLAASLYAVLTGRRPFVGNDLPGLTYAICHTEPLPPSHIVTALPAGCDALFKRALAKDPERRHQSGADLAADLTAVASGLLESSLVLDLATEARPSGFTGDSMSQAKSASGLERQAAAIGSKAGASLVRWMMAATVAAVAFTVAAGKGIKEASISARQVWRGGWQRGLPTRVAMVTAATVVAVAIVWGGFSLTRYLIESRRDTPAKQMKKAFKSLFTRIEPVGGPSGESLS